MVQMVKLSSVLEKAEVFLVDKEFALTIFLAV